MFRQKLKPSLYSIFYIGLLLRIFFLFLLPQRATTFAPDEGAYSGLTYWVSNGLDVREFPDHSNGLYERTRTYILFSTLFYRMGFDEFTATRLTSLFFFTCTSYLLLRICLKKNPEDSPIRLFLLCSLIFMFAFVNLLPSYILWSILAIRETTSHFFLLSSTLLFLKIVLEEPRLRLNIFFFVLCVGLAYGTRAQTVWILLATFLACSWLGKYSVAKKMGLTMLLLLTFYVGVSWTSSTSFLYSSERTKSERTKSLDVSSPLKNIESFTQPVDIVFELKERREVNQKFATSALTPPLCTGSGIRNYLCNSSIFGYQFRSFLFRPLPLIDTGSNLLLLASIENVFWVVMYILVLSLLLSAYKFLGMRFLLNDQYIRLTSLFLLTFSVSASMYFGNLGTGFRHKSTMLWTICLLVFQLVHLIKNNQNSRKD